jgi:dUTP pyrophosphatase
MRLRVKLLDGGTMPTRAHRYDAGLDLHAAQHARIEPGAVAKVRLGIATEIDAGWCAVLKGRSGLGARGLDVLAGVVDSSYRGEWSVVLANVGQGVIDVMPGARIAQALFVAVPTLLVERVDELPESDRGAGGFGSTGT